MTIWAFYVSLLAEVFIFWFCASMAADIMRGGLTPLRMAAICGAYISGIMLFGMFFSIMKATWRHAACALGWHDWRMMSRDVYCEYEAPKRNTSEQVVVTCTADVHECHECAVLKVTNTRNVKEYHITKEAGK